MSFIILISIVFVLLILISFLLKSNKIIMTIFVIAAIISIRIFIVQAYKMPAGSMLPTILIGDYILVNKYIYRFSDPKRCDLVIFPLPNKQNVNYVKRIVALEGDKLEIKEKKVFINGDRIVEPYTINTDDKILNPDLSPRDTFGPVIVPEKHVFVLGDNRDNSNDSRFFGFVKKETVKAKVQVVYFSIDKDNNTIRWNRIGRLLN